MAVSSKGEPVPANENERKAKDPTTLQQLIQTQDALKVSEHQRGVFLDLLTRIHKLVPVEVLPGVYAYDAGIIDTMIAQPEIFDGLESPNPYAGTK